MDASLLNNKEWAEAVAFLVDISEREATMKEFEMYRNLNQFLR